MPERCARPPDVDHHLCLVFRNSGIVDFYPDTEDPEALPARLAKVVRMFLEHPTAINCAAGFHRDGPHDDGDNELDAGG
jgi:hypothetical protein